MPKFTGFGKKSAATAVVAEAGTVVIDTAATPKTSVADTVAALEQAKTDIAVALGVEPQKPQPQNPLPPKPSLKQNRNQPKLKNSMWWRRKSFAVVRRGCFPMAPWKPNR